MTAVPALAARQAAGPVRRRWRLVIAFLVVLAGVLAALAVILEERVLGSGSMNNPFAGRRGTAFVRHGTPFRPLGVNYYNAAGDPEIFQCGTPLDEPDARLDDQFRRIRAETGANVVRFWAFRSYTSGGTDWRALDRVIRMAQAHDLMVIPVLENQWADCAHGGPRTADWYAGRYLEPDDGYPISYEEYVRRIVTRYRDEPTIFAWMLMNEAEAKRPDGSGDPDALYAFAEQMTRLVRELDPNHLVALGVIGRGQPGTADAAFERLHALRTVDLVSYHDYQADQVPLPGAHLELAGYRQGPDWSWHNGPYYATVGRAWETVTYQIPTTSASEGRSLPRRIGVTMFGDFAGDLYLDEIQAGGTTFSFEDGTAQGWQVDGAVRAEPTADRAAAGSWSLRVRLMRSNAGTQVWLDPPVDLQPGAALTFRAYVETPGTAPPNTLASAVATAARLNKPLLVSESGMATCQVPSGVAVHTPDARAARLDAKLAAFFRVGGAGYLVWTWSPDSSCGYAFSSGDPLNAVLATWAGRLAHTE
jgi:hypothetical protein